ncbi:MAG: DUF4142 domain-containing protein [Deltaproteobacteria bacterium]|nr:DUF4142 domain-containing protein [Deltaproteobacteria bacterium]
MRRLLLGALAGVFILSGSLATAQDGGLRAPPTEQVPGGTGMGGLDSPDMTLSEGEIVATVAAFNRGEITLGTFAQGRASRRDVREFARSMVSEHTEAGTRMSVLARRLNLTSIEGTESLRLTAEAAATRQQLSRLRGSVFDRAFLDAQIAAHSELIELIDHKLISSAHAADLRTALQSDIRPMVAAHLAHARSLRRRL